MKLHYLCIECQMKRHFEKAAQIENEQDRLDYIREIMRLMSESGDEPAPVYSGRCRDTEDRYLGMTAKYAALKRRYNALMLEKEEEFAQRIEAAADPLHAALLYSRAGNYIDFGSEAAFDEGMLEQIFERTATETLDEQTYTRFKSDMDKAESLVFIADNCGEIVLDKLLLIQLRKRRKDVGITVLVRGESILNDVTMEDALQVGLCGMFDVVGNGTATPGTWMPSLPENIRSMLENADVIISKGQANAECLCGCGLNVYYLLLCKCSHLAGIFSVEKYTGMFINESEAGRLV